MNDTICCSFCRKPQSATSNLVFERKGRSAAICDPCLAVCQKILKKSGTEAITDSPKSSSKSYYRILSHPREHDLLSCSFCGTSQEKTHRLIGSAPHLPPAYICDKCVAHGDARAGSRRAASLGAWIARKLGRRTTTVHHNA
jgi:ATP-dependent protease Clp ATPase subunit